MDKKEILCLYDANKKYLNKQIYRHNVKEQKPGKEYHLVVNLFCVDKGTKKILLTKRDINTTITAKYIILIQADEPVLIIRFLGKLIIIWFTIIISKKHIASIVPNLFIVFI